MTDTRSTIYNLLSRMLPGPLKALAIRFDRSPLASRDALAEFLSTRSAYVAQTSLYGYLKTRMGTQYAKLFQDETYVAAINAAKWPIFTSCVSDLTVFACATIARDANLSNEQACALATDLYRRAANHGFGSVGRQDILAAAIADFDARVALTDWAAAADGETAFGRSPHALIQHAPVSEEFRQLDGEIVRNSMRFRWTDVRRQLRERLTVPDVAADMTSSHANDRP